jgi:hypothetical protein
MICLISLLHTESTPSETPCQLSQCRVRLHVNWVNPEWDSTSTESTQKAPTFTKISSFRVDSVDVESHSALTQSTWSLTWRWLSWRGNETRRQQSHCQMLKNLNKSANSSTKSKTLKSLIIWPMYVWSVQKTGTKKSHARVPFNLVMRFILMLTNNWAYTPSHKRYEQIILFVPGWI